MIRSICLATCMVAVVASAQVKQNEVNYDESRVPDYTLPDPLLARDGSLVETAVEWETLRRPEILGLFETNVYGKVPNREFSQSHEILKVDSNALGGLAHRSEVKISISRNKRELSLRLLIYLPTHVSGPIPVFMGYNFYGNHTIHADTGILVTGSWVLNNADFHIRNNLATDSSRGVRYSRWPVEMILERGFGLVTIHYGDIDPDFDDGFQNGIHPLFYTGGQSKPAKNEWGSIAAWAWGLSRAMDYLETSEAIDPKRVIVIGHSRLGKTALWAGASDERFSMVVSNNSGSGGAALFRREFGENIEQSISLVPWWYCRNFHDYAYRAPELPVDQHMLIALIAQRPVYIASAMEDRWADPKGEYLSCYHAASVYNLYLPTILDPVQPAADQPQHETRIGYHIRSGGHDITPYDWKQFMNFADRHLNK